MGGTMRLGAYPCRLEKDSKAFRLYGEELVSERHRHRYEFNNAYKQQYIAHGMKMTGIYPKDQLVEIVELDNHPWFLAVQFHPEYKSTVAKAHPLFVGFIEAALRYKSKS